MQKGPHSTASEVPRSTFAATVVRPSLRWTPPLYLNGQWVGPATARSEHEWAWGRGQRLSSFEIELHEPPHSHRHSRSHGALRCTKGPGVCLVDDLFLFFSC